MSTVNIKLGTNYHLKRVIDGYEITFTKNGSVVKQSVSPSGVSDETITNYCDEVLPLYDGKKLVRIRENVAIKD